MTTSREGAMDTAVEQIILKGIEIGAVTALTYMESATEAVIQIDLASGRTKTFRAPSIAEGSRVIDALVEALKAGNYGVRVTTHKPAAN